MASQMRRLAKGIGAGWRACARALRAPPWAFDVATLVLTCIVTTAMCVTGGALKMMAGEVSPIWLANAVLLAQLLVARVSRRRWILAGGVLGNLASNFWAGETLGVVLSYTCSDLTEVLIAYAFVPRIAGIADLTRLRALLRFLCGVLAAPAVSGLLASVLLRGQLTGRLLPDFGNWFLSDALGLAIFTPTAIVFFTGEVGRLLGAANRRASVSVLLLVVLVTAGVFGQDQVPLLYWVLPPLVLLAFRADVAGVLVGLLLCLVIALALTMRGLGPLWIEPYRTMQGRIFALQLFFVAALCIALPVSVTQAQRNRLLELLREGERRYRILAENAIDLVMSMTLDGTLTYVSPRAHAVIGHLPEDLIGLRYPELALADDRAALANAVANLAEGGVPEASLICRFRRLDGRMRWVETCLRPVIDPFSGRPESLTATAHDITERKAAEERLADERNELRGLAFRDALTGLFNRRYFDRELALQWQRHAAGSRTSCVAVVMIDVDAYKNYNDCYGHQRGDECLHVVAQAIAGAARRATDVVARYGGEEFALILGNTDRDEALQVAESVRASVESLRIEHAGSAVGVVTISAGIAIAFPAAGVDERSLVAAADRALYAAKRRGRNRVCDASDLDRGDFDALLDDWRLLPGLSPGDETV